MSGEPTGASSVCGDEWCNDPADCEDCLAIHAGIIPPPAAPVTAVTGE